MAATEHGVLLQHLLGLLGAGGFIGCSFAPLMAVMEARRTCNLGGLDTRDWPLIFTNLLIWSCYSYRSGDAWVFISAAPPAIMWLFFNLTAIRLLALEQGELDSSVKAWEGGVIRCKTVYLAELCEKYRKECINKLERGIVAGFGIACIASFCCSPWNIAGLEFLEIIITPDFKMNVFGNLCCLSSLVTFTKPLSRLCVLYKRQDASTIFLPLVITSLFTNTFMLSYAIVTANLYVLIPNAAGMLVCMAQLLLKLLFCRGHAEALDEKAADDEEESPDLQSVIPAPWTPKSQALSEVSTVLVDDESNPSSPRFSQCKSNLSGLPDLTDRLKEQGMYEDYLKWQQSYKKWRKGGVRGSQGELEHITPKPRGNSILPAIPDPDAVLPFED
eukprot:CAMPEP_0197620166 /NCGR_PEP_ID=MMETSP1338-20131121/1029_1 /TAXON_ID=43686 ORGANISM="Pelagodinium beii, Strain RCC1491" /NCGR_SAMPLE_ID=MMETSP1338 /ASSEMBLY_ACC=CAM_ASM_000754 /LENGTH=387 /DNA_ID=CAMNT_0043189265 /DNA_START=39 /DNA_END=1202 /DNA_ORIENTATION=+